MVTVVALLAVAIVLTFLTAAVVSLKDAARRRRVSRLVGGALLQERAVDREIWTAKRGLDERYRQFQRDVDSLRRNR